MAQQYEEVTDVLERLVKVLRGHDLDTSHSISKDDFQRAISEVRKGRPGAHLLIITIMGRFTAKLERPFGKWESL